MNKEMRKNEKKGRVGRRLLGVLLALNLFISAFAGIQFFRFSPDQARAADGDEDKITIMIAGKAYDEANKYQMKSDTAVLKLDDESAKRYKSTEYTVTWEVFKGGDIIKITSDIHDRASISIAAQKYGKDALIRVIVEKTSGTFFQSAFCGIDVVFGIDTWGDEFKTISGERALFLGLNETRTLKIGLGGSATWKGDDTDVISVNSSTGTVTAVGAGTAKVTATGTGEGESDKITVYCAPGVSQTDGGPYVSSLPNCEVENGGFIYTNAKFNAQTPMGFGDKIYWEVTDQTGAVVASSTKPTSESISIINPTGIYDNRLKITGVSGKYRLNLYTTGTYNAYKEDTSLYEPARIDLTIKSSIANKNVILGVNDKYNLYQAFNITKSDFYKYFGTPVIRMYDPLHPEDDPGDYGQEVPQKTATLEDYVVTAKQEADIIAVMKVTDDPIYKAELQKLTGLTKLPGYFTITFSITDRITLSSDSMEMMKGTKQTLHVTKNSNFSGTVSWATSDASKVTVEGNGLNAVVEAKEIVKAPGVTITATMDIGGGISRVAYCQITVIDALSDFELDHKKKLTLHVDQTEPVRVVVPSDTGAAELPLIWSQSTNDEIVSIEPQDGNRWAWIGGKKGGTTTLMVTNTLDGTVKRLDIEVVVAVESLKFQSDNYSFPYYQAGKLMSTFLEIKPEDATASEIVWSSSNTSVGAIDEETGYLTFVNPGTTTITAKVKNDYVGIPVATTTVKITGSPEEIIFENLKDNHLELEAGDTKTVNLKFVPDTAETKLIWKTDKADIVLADYNSEKRTVDIIGRNPGNVTVTCRTEDNVYYSFTVTVKQASSGVEFKEKSITLYRGDPVKGIYQMKPTLKPENSTDSVTYKMRDDKIAKVDANGLVTAVAAGTTYLMATTTSGKTAVVDVIVVDMVTGLKSDFRSAIVYIGETLTITPTVVPETAANKKVKWYAEPQEPGGSAEVELAEKGTSVDVTGKSPGLVLLTGESEDNASAKVTYILNVKYRNPQYKTVVTLTPKTKYVNVGTKFKVQRSVKNAYKGNKRLKWKSSNRKVATVNSSGVVRAKKVGKTTITATARDGSKAKGKMTVVVRRLVTKITMSRTSANVMIGKSIRLRVKVTPSNATIKGVTWSSGDTAIATVDGGKVIGVGAGMVKITATSKDAKKKKCYCWVTVSEPVPVTSFTITDTNITIAKGSSAQSGIVPNPTNATDSIKFWSDNPAIASVSSRGKITAKKVGKATIYARAANGVEGHADVTVVDLNRKAVTLRQYDTEQLRVNMISTGVTWYSGSPNIASVDENGVVKAKMPGTTIIYAIVDGVKLGCKVTVKRIT